MTSTTARFEGRTAIVTGAGSGIGRATAVRLAQEGARVVASDISAERLAELTAEHPELALVTVAGDVSTEAVARQLAAEAGDRIDVLANVARVMNVNVTAIMRLTRAVLPKMIEAGSGTIVNVASEAGLRGSAAGVAYTTSKHAVIGYTKNTAFMYAPKGIRVNAVAPGAVATNIEAPWNSEWAAGRLGPLMQVVIPGVATPEQLAAAITWLASDDSANVTGVVLASDGGWSAI